jgi:pentatricopeptide repeat protein
MKKRAQFPDGHTYAIIFNGCALHPQPSNALAKALPIYHSMMTEKSPVRPTVVHVNAVLKICARAGNMDAMLAIAEDMPSKGVGSPNNLSYTTIFNALRFSAVGDLRNTLTPMQKRQNTQKAMLEARRMWFDISKRWGRGELWVDEELVCSFGRLLLIGGRQDVDDILSLIEQTMNIPRQIPRLGTDARREVDPQAQRSESSLQLNEEASSADPIPEQVAGNPQSEVAVVDLFEPIASSSTPSPPRGLFAKPGQNSFSLILEALLEMKLKGTAQKYWQILTSEHNIQPDRENYHAYLRILRVARASNEAIDVILSMSIRDLTPSTFRIAMAACRRDKLNKNAFANGGKLLDLMQTALREPDIPFLEEYLELAVTAPAYSKKISSSGESDWSKYSQGKQILRALERLNPSFLNLKALLHFGDPRLTEKSPTEKTKFVDAILSLIRKMIGIYDLLMDKAMVPRDFFKPLSAQRGKLSAFVNRHKKIMTTSSSHNAVQWSADAMAAIAAPESTPDVGISEEPDPLKSKALSWKNKTQELAGVSLEYPSDQKQRKPRLARDGLGARELA